MKTYVPIACILIILSETGVAQQGWQKIKALRQQESSAKTSYKEYLKNLSKEELLSSARECAWEWNAKTNTDSRSNAFADMRFLADYYPEEDGGISDVPRLIGGIKDEANPVYFREFVAECLVGPWVDKLNREDLWSVHEVLGQVLASTNSPRDAFCDLPKRMVSILRNLRRSAVGHPSDMQRVDASGGKLVDTLVELPERENLSENMRQSALSALITCHRDRIGDQKMISERVRSMFVNYASYPESLWPSLARAVVEQIAVESTASVLEEMRDKSRQTSTKRLLEFARYRWEKKTK